MKIALMSLNYLPSTGGLVSYLINFSEYLIRKGHEVTIFCAKERNDDSPEFQKDGNLKIIRINALNISTPLKIITPLLIFYKLRKWFKANTNLNDFDIVITRHFYMAAAIKGLMKVNKSIFIIPLISSRLLLINSKTETIIKKIYSYLLIPQVLIIEKLAVSGNQAIGVLSESKFHEIKKFYKKENVKIIYPGFNENKFKPNCHYKTNPLSEIKILTVARLVEEKNIKTIINSLSILENLNPDIKFTYTIVGDGPLKRDLEEYASKKIIKNNVIFTGFITETEIFYKNSDLFILISTYEGFGHVYIESNACGTPVIGLSANGKEIITACDEIIENNTNGYLLKENDPESLSRIIKYFIENENHEKIRTSSRAYAVNNFSWDTHLQKIKECLDES